VRAVPVVNCSQVGGGARHAGLGRNGPQDAVERREATWKQVGACGEQMAGKGEHPKADAGAHASKGAGCQAAPSGMTGWSEHKRAKGAGS